jgi:hypothetical protein
MNPQRLVEFWPPSKRQQSHERAAGDCSPTAKQRAVSDWLGHGSVPDHGHQGRTAGRPRTCEPPTTKRSWLGCLPTSWRRWTVTGPGRSMPSPWTRRSTTTIALPVSCGNLLRRWRGQPRRVPRRRPEPDGRRDGNHRLVGARYTATAPVRRLIGALARVPASATLTGCGHSSPWLSTPTRRSARAAGSLALIS